MIWQFRSDLIAELYLRKNNNAVLNNFSQIWVTVCRCIVFVGIFLFCSKARGIKSLFQQIFYLGFFKSSIKKTQPETSP